jgi:hypothetical protein
MFRVGHGGAAVARPSSMLNSVNSITFRPANAAQLPALAHKQTSRGHLGQVRFALDCVAKLFCSSERARLIQTSSVNAQRSFKNPFAPIRLLRIFILNLLRGDFCNTIRLKSGHFSTHARTTLTGAPCSCGRKVALRLSASKVKAPPGLIA